MSVTVGGPTLGPPRMPRCACGGRDGAQSRRQPLWAGTSALVGVPGLEPGTSSLSGLLRDLAHMHQARSSPAECCPRVTVMTLGGLPHRARIGHDLLLRRRGRIVQGRPLRSVRWADIPQLSTRGKCCPAAWQQYWQQSRRNGFDPRPSAFQAGHILSWRGSCECHALSLAAAVSGCLLLLLSPLLSVRWSCSHLRGLPGRRDRAVLGVAALTSHPLALLHFRSILEPNTTDFRYS
jgi:hypothetical protein